VRGLVPEDDRVGSIPGVPAGNERGGELGGARVGSRAGTKWRAHGTRSGQHGSTGTACRARCRLSAASRSHLDLAGTSASGVWRRAQCGGAGSSSRRRIACSILVTSSRSKANRCAPRRPVRRASGAGPRRIYGTSAVLRGRPRA